LHLASFLDDLADKNFAKAADGGDDKWRDGLGKRLVGDLVVVFSGGGRWSTLLLLEKRYTPF
jgi:hypothetical protein